MQVRRSLLTALALGSLLVAHGAEAQTTRRRATTARTTATMPPPALSVGGLVGLEFSEGETGFSLRADGEWPFQMLTPRLLLSGVGSLGYTRFSDSVGIFDYTWNIFKLVPAARFTFPLAPELSVYGDAGVGLYLANSSVDAPVPVTDDSETGFGLTLRFAAGGFYEAAPRLRLGAELGVNPFFGDFEDTTISLLVGVMYRL